MVWSIRVYTSRSTSYTDYGASVEHVSIWRGCREPFQVVANRTRFELSWREGALIPSAIERGQKIIITDGTHTYEGRIGYWELAIERADNRNKLFCDGLDAPLYECFVMPERAWNAMSSVDLATEILFNLRHTAPLNDDGTNDYLILGQGSFPYQLYNPNDYFAVPVTSGASGRTVYLTSDRWGDSTYAIDALREVALHDGGRLLTTDKIRYYTGYEWGYVNANAASAASYDDSVARIDAYPRIPFNSISLTATPRYIGTPDTIVMSETDLRIDPSKTKTLRHAFKAEDGSPQGVYFLCNVPQAVVVRRAPLKNPLITLEEMPDESVDIRLISWSSSAMVFEVENYTTFPLFVSFQFQGVPIMLGDAGYYEVSDSEGILNGQKHQFVNVPFSNGDLRDLSMLGDWLLFQQSYLSDCAYAVTRRNPTTTVTLGAKVTIASAALELTSATYIVIGEQMSITPAGFEQILFVEPFIRTFKIGDALNSGYPLGWGVYSEAVPIIDDNQGEICNG